MYEIYFANVMSGKRRVAIPRAKVAGYKHTYCMGIHFYRRGNIGYMFTTYDDPQTFERFNYARGCYEEVTYEEFHKFINIKEVEQ